MYTAPSYTRCKVHPNSTLLLAVCGLPVQLVACHSKHPSLRGLAVQVLSQDPRPSYYKRGTAEQKLQLQQSKEHCQHLCDVRLAWSVSLLCTPPPISSSVTKASALLSKPPPARTHHHHHHCPLPALLRPGSPMIPPFFPFLPLPSSLCAARRSMFSLYTICCAFLS